MRDDLGRGIFPYCDRGATTKRSANAQGLLHGQSIGLTCKRRRSISSRSFSAYCLTPSPANQYLPAHVDCYLLANVFVKRDQPFILHLCEIHLSRPHSLVCALSGIIMQSVGLPRLAASTKAYDGRSPARREYATPSSCVAYPTELCYFFLKWLYPAFTLVALSFLCAGGFAWQCRIARWMTQFKFAAPDARQCSGTERTGSRVDTQGNVLVAK
jgi:hypothetical protein